MLSGSAGTDGAGARAGRRDGGSSAGAATSAVRGQGAGSTTSASRGLGTGSQPSAGTGSEPSVGTGGAIPLRLRPEARLRGGIGRVRVDRAGPRHPGGLRSRRPSGGDAATAAGWPRRAAPRGPTASATGPGCGPTSARRPGPIDPDASSAQQRGTRSGQHSDAERDDAAARRSDPRGSRRATASRSASESTVPRPRRLPRPQGGRRRRRPAARSAPSCARRRARHPTPSGTYERLRRRRRDSAGVDEAGAGDPAGERAERDRQQREQQQPRRRRLGHAPEHRDAGDHAELRTRGRHRRAGARRRSPARRRRRAPTRRASGR